MLAGSRWLREVPLVLEGCLDLAIGRLLLAVLRRLVLHFPASRYPLWAFFFPQLAVEVRIIQPLGGTPDFCPTLFITTHYAFVVTQVEPWPWLF